MEKSMKKSSKIIIIVVVALLAAAVIAGGITGIVFGVNTTPYEGIVTDSKSGAPLANVSVSDGKNVVKTDASGKYKLKGWHKSNFVTVTIPSGYWTESYYLRKDKAVESYNFKLDKLDRDFTDHNFLQVTDSEIGSKGVGKEWFSDVKAEVASKQPAFIMHTGDICYEDGLKQHIRDMNYSTMGVPVRYSMGNHDYVNYGSYGEQLFEELYGPTWYSFDVGNIHYVVTPMGYGDYPGRYNLSETWRWLANDLANVEEGKKIVLFNHDNASEQNDFVVKYSGKKLDLKEKGLISWIFGHWHYNMVNKVDDVYNICTTSPSGGGIDSAPSAIRTIEIKGNTFKGTTVKYINYEGARTTDEVNIWQTQLDGRNLFSNPVIYNDNIIVATIDDSYPNKPSVSSVSSASGMINWSYNPTNSVRSDIFVSDDKIIFQDVEGIVYALNSSGVLMWKRDLNLSNLRNTTMSLLVEKNVIYCGNSRSVSALQVANGEVIWNKNINKGENSPYKLVVQGNTLIVGAHWDRYYFLDTSNGKQIAKSAIHGIYTTNKPLVMADKMIATATNSIIEMDYKGATIKETVFKGYTFNTASTPIIIDNIGYFATSNVGVVAIDMTTMAVKWNYKTGENMFFTSPYTSFGASSVEGGIYALASDKLIFGANDGFIHIVDKASGELIAKYDVGAPITSGIVGDDVIHVVDFEGRVTAIDIKAILKN